MIRPILLLMAVAAASGLHCQERSYQPGLDVLHYDFTIQLPDSGRQIGGRALLTVRRSAPLKHIIVDLVGLRVDTVRVNAESVDFKREPGVISIPIGPPAGSTPDTVLITIRYGGEVTDGLIIRTDRTGRWYAFGDNWPERARYWLPTLDHPDDKATVSWTIIAPNDRKIVANGALVEEKELPLEPASGSRIRTLTRWSTARPIPTYLMVIAAGRLVPRDLGLTAPGLSEFPPGVRQTVYAVPEVSDYLPGPFAKAGEIVELFARIVAPFPYEKLAHVQSLTRYGGMENASAIFYSDSYFRRRSMNPGVIAHETAHQWFGDAVTPRSWGHLWLSEGFASYFEELWVERTKGISDFQKDMSRLRDEIIESRATFERPVVDTLQTDLVQLLNTNSYQKGAWTLHMIRSLLGDSLFFTGIRAYYADHRHATATTDDLCEAFERTSRTGLRWFFDQWLRRPGFPHIEVGWDFNQELHQVTVSIEQGTRFPAYRFPLKIKMLTGDGHSRFVTIDVPAEESVKLQLPVVIDARPTNLIFDPEVELLASIKVK